MARTRLREFAQRPISWPQVDSSTTRRLLGGSQARVVVVTKRRDDQLLCFQFEGEIETADVTALDVTGLRPVLQLGMMDWNLTRGAAPRHSVPPPLPSVRNPPRGRLRKGRSEITTFPTGVAFSASPMGETLTIAIDMFACRSETDTCAGRRRISCALASLFAPTL